MHLTWEIAKREGKTLGWIRDHQEGECEIHLNGQRTASVSASLEERLVRRIHPNRSRIKVWLHRSEDDPRPNLLHNGLVVEPRVDGRRLVIPSVCPSVRLLNASYAPLPTPAELALSGDTFWDEDTAPPSDVMWALINKSDKRIRDLEGTSAGLQDPPTLGITRGTSEDYEEGDERPYKLGDGQTTWDRLVEESERNRAPDFELEPLNRDDGVFARFNTYRKMGSDRSEDVILVEDRNCAEVVYEPGSEMVNRYALSGTGGATSGRAPCFVAESRVSIGRFGVWQRDEGANTTDLAELEQRAKAYVAKNAFPKQALEVIPAVQEGGTAHGWQRDAEGNLMDLGPGFAVPPTFGPGEDFDYWLGDEVQVQAPRAMTIEVDKDRPAPDGVLYARVMMGRFEEVDASANVVVTHEILPNLDKAEVTGYETIVDTGGR